MSLGHPRRRERGWSRVGTAPRDGRLGLAVAVGAGVGVGVGVAAPLCDCVSGVVAEAEVGIRGFLDNHATQRACPRVLMNELPSTATRWLLGARRRGIGQRASPHTHARVQAKGTGHDRGSDAESTRLLDHLLLTPELLVCALDIRRKEATLPSPLHGSRPTTAAAARCAPHCVPPASG
eukprot:COSAG01_NODE_96_length_26789_cov_36.697089_5_plen_179_part_00